MLTFLSCLVLFSEAIPAVAGLYFLPKFNSLRISIFVFLLVYSALNEYAATYYILEGYGNNNHLFYNIRAFIHIPLLLLLYISLIKIKAFRITLSVIIIALLGQLAFSATVENIKFGYFFFNSIAGGLSIILATTFYLIDLLRHWDGMDLKSNLWLYVSLGFLLFYVVATPIEFTLQIAWFKTSSESLVSFFKLLRKLQSTVIILMNVIITLGFLWAKKKYN